MGIMGRNIVQKNQLLFRADFYPIHIQPIQGLNEVGAFMGKMFREKCFWNKDCLPMGIDLKIETCGDVSVEL